MDGELLKEVPGVLKKLARYIVRGFYGPEHVIVIDMLVRNPCVKEEDLIELLKFERKQLRSTLNTLKTDRFLKSRMKVETADGKNTKHNYYFINYKVFVNVVKYKLDHMRRKIEMEERDNTSRASFRCPSCEKTFTDLEADQLYDPFTSAFCCTFCSTEVEEDESARPNKDARMMLAKFNEQIRPLFDLLIECEGIKLAPEILEPEPTDLRPVLHKAKGGSGQRAGEGSAWSGDASRNRGFGTTENTVTVTMKKEGDNSPSKEILAPKAVPVWLKESTVAGATTTEQEQAIVNVLEPSTSWQEGPKSESRDDIMRTLLVHEKKAASAPRIPGNNASDDESSTSESDQEVAIPRPPAAAIVEEMESEEDEDSTPVVTIAGTKVPLSDVTNDMVEKMTPSEKEEYIRLSQEMYEDMCL